MLDKLLRAYGGAGEIVRDLHVYGGLVMLAGGVGWLTHEPGAGVAAAGALLMALPWLLRRRAA